MSLEDLRRDYITFPEIAHECGVSLFDAHNWAKYHRYFPKHDVLGKPAVLRSDFEQFKINHPELINKTETIAA